MDDFCIIEEALAIYLEKNSISFQECNKRMNEILKNEKINFFFSDADEITFNKEETKLIREYLNLENRIYSLENLYAYLRGYIDHEKTQTIFNKIG
ncbi:hypothetical protein IMSAGC017_00756 [Thomasclavelia cocleata]|uniref:Uncharacterized protein n=1 Tax=Thomasclavelia cocleata TaxID=69824 RepID=A0A829Z8M1_9FIRM|nr:hypothetical protein [Thomasclavelia cocleata]GFI40721.1 hypothetical protein IMSAGC017_00756 [Thomasclavelia cocleata]